MLQISAVTVNLIAMNLQKLQEFFIVILFSWPFSLMGKGIQERQQPVSMTGQTVSA